MPAEVIGMGFYHNIVAKRLKKEIVQMRRALSVVSLAVVTAVASFFVMTADASAQKLGQVYMRGAYARSMTDRGDDLLTGNIPVLGPAPAGLGVFGDDQGIHDKDGYGIATGINIMVAPKDPLFGQEVWGEVGLEYARFGDGDRAPNLPAALEAGLGLPSGSLAQDSSSKAEIGVSIFNVHIGPKLRLNFGDPEPGKMWTLKRLHPYLVAGMMFGVISPPSDDVTYIDIGALVVAGFDYVLPPLGGLFGIGMDYRHHFFGGATGEDIDYGSAGVFITVNF